MWVPLLILFGGLIVGLNALQRDARERGVARIDVTRYRLMAQSQWLSAAWTDELERILVEVRSLPVDDPEQLAAFAQEVADLPFVAEVGAYTVQWPDGLILPMRLREPVACIRTGGRDFLPVAADGTVLGGYTYAPHEAYGGWLPTLGPHGVVEKEQGLLEPGDKIEVPEVLAALAVADSMWAYMGVEDLRRLGRVVIDASAQDAPVLDRAATALKPARLPGGVKIDLEEGRRIFFGRPPIPIHSGELPVGYKWAHIRNALEAMEAAGRPWALLDVRFDEPIQLTRVEVEEIVERSQKGSEGSTSER
ncbi:hypothetical protein Poly30_31960 [Planctomycetes bacterium Poly30]|uniref:Cell division protein FtsQ n=1 Tax=Saltatorellus ferox TaxID=2528018 RepID=A0A518EUE5_9BACT|nr:hypothetical protein Poly30_31960 [Planctomycetes bacterium Poly30]